MKNWKTALAAFTISAMALGPNLADPAFAKKAKKTEPINNAPAAPIETGQLLIRDKPVAKPAGDAPVDAPAAEFGVDGQILDRGKGRYSSKPAGDQSSGAAENELCGVPYTSPCVTQAAEYGVDGQILDRGKGRPVAKPAGDAPVDAPAANWEDPKGGQHMIRDRPAANPGQPPADAPAAADDPCKRPGVQCDPRDSRDAAKKAKPKGAGESGKTLGLLAGASAAVIAAIVLASGGDDNPTSP